MHGLTATGAPCIQTYLLPSIPLSCEHSVIVLGTEDVNMKHARTHARDGDDHCSCSIVPCFLFHSLAFTELPARSWYRCNLLAGSLRAQAPPRQLNRTELTQAQEPSPVTRRARPIQSHCLVRAVRPFILLPTLTTTKPKKSVTGKERHRTFDIMMNCPGGSLAPVRRLAEILSHTLNPRVRVWPLPPPPPLDAGPLAPNFTTPALSATAPIKQTNSLRRHPRARRRTSR
ncbi:hypothetical protein OF83DRAFT_16173 [Amylostereum chailletii]|nr:hypothetical protein OF83DRAFT_16173 [Amylostereum chailletii]